MGTGHAGIGFDRTEDVNSIAVLLETCGGRKGQTGLTVIYSMAAANRACGTTDDHSVDVSSPLAKVSRHLACRPDPWTISSSFCVTV